jgi:Zn-dependent protease with chaperone function
MKQKMYKVVCGIYFLGLILFPAAFCVYASNGASFDKAAQEKIIQTLLHQHIRIMPQLNHLNFGFGQIGNLEYFFTKSTSKIFYQQQPIKVEIIQIRFENGTIIMDLEHPRLGAGQIHFTISHEFQESVKAEDVSSALLTSFGDENLQYVFVNPGERIYHLYTSNHLLDRQKVIRTTRTEAEAEGYEACGVCFKKVLYLPQIEVEMMIEREWWSRMQNLQSVLDCSESQADLQRLGEKILDNWPLPLLGYEYTFYLANSPLLSAFAIPTGKIVVTSAILNSLESEEELEALLLLAIAHVERRHSLKQYLVKQAEAESYQRLMNLAGTAGSIAGMFAGGMWGAVGSAAIPDSQETPRPVLGFQEDLEKEADLLAALYFDIQGKDKRHMVSLLRKLQFNEMADLRHPEKLHHKRLTFEKRIDQIEKVSFQYFGNEKSFVFKPKKGFPTQLNLLYQRMLNQDNKLDVYISNASILQPSDQSGKEKEISLSIEDKNGSYELKNLEQYNTHGLWGIYLTFKASNDGKKPLSIENIEALVLKVRAKAAERERDSGPAVVYYKFIPSKPTNELSN